MEIVSQVNQLIWGFYGSRVAGWLRGFSGIDADVLFRRRLWGRSDLSSHNPAATAPAQVIELRPRDSRSAIRLPRRGMSRDTCQAMPPATAATTIDLLSSNHGNSASETNLRRSRRMAATTVLATIPRSEAMASPTTESSWNKYR